MIGADHTAYAQLRDAGMPPNEARAIIEELALARDEIVVTLMTERDRAQRLLDQALNALETRTDRATRFEVARKTRAELAGAVAPAEPAPEGATAPWTAP